MTFHANAMPGAVGEIFSIACLDNNRSGDRINLACRNARSCCCPSGCIGFDHNFCDLLKFCFYLAYSKAASQIRDIAIIAGAPINDEQIPQGKNPLGRCRMRVGAVGA